MRDKHWWDAHNRDHTCTNGDGTYRAVLFALQSPLQLIVNDSRMQLIVEVKGFSSHYLDAVSHSMLKFSMSFFAPKICRP